MTERPSRPGSVTVVVVLTWLYAIGMLLGGALWLFAAGNDSAVAELDVNASTVTIYGWTFIVFGVVTMLTAAALGRGSRLARFIITAVMTLRIAVDVFGLLSISGYPGWQAGISIAWAVVIVALLHNRRASLWFLRT